MFVPVAFMKGIVGKFFFPFGVTVAVAVLVSLFVSFTLDPMLSSDLARPAGDRLLQVPVIGHMMRGDRPLLDVLHGIYERLIHWIFSARRYRVLVPPVPACGHPFDAAGSAIAARAGLALRARITPRGDRAVVGVGQLRRGDRARAARRHRVHPGDRRQLHRLNVTLPVGTSLDARQRQDEAGRGPIVRRCPRSRHDLDLDRRHRQRQPQLGAAVDPADQAARAQAERSAGRGRDPQAR